MLVNVACGNYGSAAGAGEEAREARRNVDYCKVQIQNSVHHSPYLSIFYGTAIRKSTSVKKFTAKSGPEKKKK